jgi:hypothetical protein
VKRLQVQLEEYGLFVLQTDDGEYFPIMASGKAFSTQFASAKQLRRDHGEY